MDFQTRFADAVVYWERKRIIYNVILAVLVLVCWGRDILAACGQLKSASEKLRKSERVATAG